MPVTNQYFVAPMDIYPYQQVPPFAQLEVFGSTSVFDNMEAPRWALYQMDGLTYDPDLKGLVLTPNWPPWQNMNLANFTVDTTKFSVCNPFGDSYSYLYCYNGPVNQNTLASSSTILPANPWFSMDFLRWAPPAGQTVDNCTWQLFFGGGWQIAWGLHMFPQVLYNNVLVSQLTFTSGDEGEYLTANRMQFMVKVAGPYLYITCDAFPSGAWRIPLVVSDGQVAAGGWSIQGGGGQWAVNLSPWTFPTSGTAITPWIETFAMHSDVPEPSGPFIATPYPAPLNTTIGIAPVATNGTQKQYQITMTSLAGSTDVIQSMSLEYMPVFSTTSYGSWLEITPWVIEAEENFSERGARSTSVTLRPGIVVGGQTLAQFAGSVMQGQFAFKYQIYPDPNIGDNAANMGAGQLMPAGVQRMCGIMTGNLDRRAVNKADSLTLTAYDKWKQLDDTEVIFPVSCCNMNLGDAIGKIAQWGGIPLANINILTASAPVVINGIDYTTPNNIILNDPTYDYTSPPWTLAKGATAGEFIKHLAQTFNLLVEMTSAGNLNIGLQPPYVATVPGSYSYAPGADPLYALEHLEDEIDLTGAKNIVLLECKDAYGNPVVLSAVDTAATTPGNNRFLGYYAFEYHSVPDVTSALNITLALAGLFAQAARGWQKVRFASHTAAMLSLYAWPGQRLTLYDPAKLGTVLVTITNIKQTLSLQHGNVPEIRGEIRSA